MKLYMKQIRVRVSILILASVLVSSLLPQVVRALEGDGQADIEITQEDLGNVAGVIIPHTGETDLPEPELIVFPEKPKPVVLAHAYVPNRPVYRVPESHLDPLFEKYGEAYGVSAQKLKAIAFCESGFNTNARGSGIYGGMYQYLDSTWASTRRAMGMSEDQELKYDPEEAIRTTAWKIAAGGIGAWPVCGKK